MRRTKVVTIATEGRDFGKSFLITEMSSWAGERWAYRALLALSRGGFELPPGIFDAGMAGLAPIVPYLLVVGFRALHAARWEELEVLLEEMMQCVQFKPSDPQLLPQPLRSDATCQIEEIRTRVELRKEVLMLHVDPFVLAAFQTSESGDKVESPAS